MNKKSVETLHCSKSSILTSSFLQPAKTLKWNLLTLNHSMTKPTKWPVRPAKTQISLDTCPVCSEPSLRARWVADDPRVLHADSEDSDQTERMPFCWFCNAAAQLIIIITVKMHFINIWAVPCENVSYVICEQQRRRSACASARSDQRLCCSLLR